MSELFTVEQLLSLISPGDGSLSVSAGEKPPYSQRVACHQAKPSNAFFVDITADS